MSQRLTADSSVCNLPKQVCFRFSHLLGGYCCKLDTIKNTMDMFPIQGKCQARSGIGLQNRYYNERNGRLPSLNSQQ